MIFRFIFSAAFILVASTWLPSPADARRIVLADLGSLVAVADPQFSPDGASVAVVVARPDYESDTFPTQLVLVDIASRRQRVLTAAYQNVAMPRWSRRGDRLAFLADLDEKTQLFVMRMSDGSVRQITTSPTGVDQYAWRPDGQSLAYVAEDAAPRHAPNDDAFVVGNNDYLTMSAPTPAQLWLVSADGSNRRRLTSGPAGLSGLSPSYASASPISWSPDGSAIAFARLPSAYDDDSNRQDIRIVDVASGRVRKLTSGVYQMMPLWSPNGASVAYLVPRAGDYNQVTQFFAAPAGGGSSFALTTDLDRNMLWGAWLPTGAGMLVGADDGAQTSMWLQPLHGAPRKLNLGDVDWEDASTIDWTTAGGIGGTNWKPASISARGAIAFTGSEPNRPMDLYYLATPNSRPQRLTDFGHPIAALDLGRTSGVAWTGPNGFAEDGILTYPPVYVAGKKYPLVVYVHGGPIYSSSTAFDELCQLLAARDFLVFQPNYRGSDNLGNAYQRAIYRDAGDGPGKDVMAGIAALEARGIVDTSRIAVSGWSYGGYMTSWLIGHYHIWKAAVSGAAVNDWFVDYATADDHLADSLQLGVTPWTDDGYREYLRQSPIADAAAITTPTLIMSDVGDVRVPVTQSYELFHALRDNHVPVEFVAYPVSGHVPDDPVRNADIDRRWVEWMVRYLR